MVMNSADNGSSKSDRLNIKGVTGASRLDSLKSRFMFSWRMSMPWVRVSSVMTSPKYIGRRPDRTRDDGGDFALQQPVYLRDNYDL